MFSCTVRYTLHKCTIFVCVILYKESKTLMHILVAGFGVFKASLKFFN